MATPVTSSYATIICNGDVGGAERQEHLYKYVCSQHAINPPFPRAWGSTFPGAQGHMPLAGLEFAVGP